MSIQGTEYNAIGRDVSVVVPVFNSEESLQELCTRLGAVLKSVAGSYELILVNDASEDRSWGEIRQLTSRLDWVRGIDLMRNYGQHNALLCGIFEARYPVIVTLDDDLQHPPEEIPRLLEALDKGADVVFASPQREKHGFWRNVATLVTRLVLRRAMGATLAQKVSSFRAFRTEIREAFRGFGGPFVNVDVLLTWGSGRYASVPVRHDPRKHGQTNYTFVRLIKHTLNMMTGFSALPLQFASALGFLLTLFGVGLLLYVVTKYLIMGSEVAGFYFLTSIIALFSGAQLFGLGIMGEYLARIHFQTMKQPPFAIRDRSGSQPD